VTEHELLAAQRQEIRDRLLAQRQRIAQQLAPGGDARGVYPRSMTMRLLIRRPELLARLLGVIADRLTRKRRAP
jgi:hypothetical protein